MLDVGGGYSYNTIGVCTLAIPGHYSYTSLIIDITSCSIKLSGLAIPTSSLVASTSGITIKASGLTMKVNADWKYREHSWCV